MVVNAAPTSTTNITGFFATILGLSFTNDSLVARFTISGSNNGRARTPLEMSCEASCLASCLLSTGGALWLDILTPHSQWHFRGGLQMEPTPLEQFPI